MLVHAHRDAPRLPALAAVLSPWDDFVAEVRDGLVAGWAVNGSGRARLAAAIGHALRFETWRSLARVEGLGDVEAVELMVSLARVAAEVGLRRAD
jgi:hypothetical protein